MSTKVNELTPKVDRYTVTDPDGQLSATEYNVMLDAVQRHETQLDNNDFLRFSEQALDDSDKRQARQNIGVVGEGDYAPKMSVGFADNLVGRGEATPEEFVFQPTANDVSVQDGTARIAKIKGNSVVWNQQYQPYIIGTQTSNGVTVITDSDGTITANGTANGGEAVMTISQVVKIRANHKYLILAEGTIDGVWKEQAVYLMGIGGLSIVTNGHSIFSWPSDISANLTLTVWNGFSVECKFKPIIVNLTQMFDAGNEPSTVEDFYARIPLGVDIHAYNPGEIISMHTEAIKTVGFNQWDEQWEVGAIDGNNGALVANGSAIRSGFIQVVAGSVYNIQCPTQVILCAYDDKYQYIKWLLWGGNTSQFTIPHNCKYIKFCTYGTAYGSIYNNDICINLSHTGVEDGKYKPYTPFTRELSVIKKYFPNGMRSAGTAFDSIEWDSTKQKWVAVQRVGVVDLGDLNWALEGSYNVTCAEIGAAIPYQADLPNIITLAPMKAVSVNKATAAKNSEEVYINPENKKMQWYADTSLYPNVASLKAAMQGVMLYYELAEPIVTEIEGLPELDYLVWDFGTEEAISSVPSAPFKADIIYQFNAVDRIRENTLRVQQLEAMIAQMQAAFASMQAQEASTLIE